MSRAERAKELFLQGYACSQAVALAFTDVMQINEEEIAKLEAAIAEAKKQVEDKQIEVEAQLEKRHAIEASSTNLRQSE